MEIQIDNLTTTERTAFSFLFELEESGITNMFSAAPFLKKRINRADYTLGNARYHLLFWMENYDELKNKLS